jgi:alpha-1,3-mannosyl-glycoprotein beta-1,2-N-acetylglucosaminyltransferase
LSNLSFIPAPDFFEYFAATRPLLDQDQSLWCVSAWNDNGKEGMVKGNDLLYRTDFFSGLGWMLTKNVWDELRSKWPLGFWDDWMRDPAQHKNRACIRPEICRTRTFGKIGVSRGQFFDQHLKFIKLNDKKFPFTEVDVSYLLKEKYDPQFKHKLNSIPVATVQQLKSSNLQEVQVQYSSSFDFEQIARSFGVMSDFKAGIARVSYQGVVSFMFQGTRVFLVPKKQL